VVCGLGCVWVRGQYIEYDERAWMELPSPEDVFSNALTSIDSLTHNVESLTYSDINLTH